MISVYRCLIVQNQNSRFYQYANSQIQETKLALKVRSGLNPDQPTHLAEEVFPIHKYNKPDQD